MELRITIEIWQKGKWFISKCPELDFISQGETSEEAKKNLLEVIQIQFEEMEETGTLDEYLAECSYEKRDNVIIPKIEMIGFEKFTLQVA
jgi:predicted RNase H-like HicB family nuclease